MGIKLTKEEKTAIRAITCCLDGTCKDHRGELCPFLHDIKTNCVEKVMKKALDVMEKLSPGITEEALKK